jgi:hypothetical protein
MCQAHTPAPVVLMMPDARTYHLARSVCGRPFKPKNSNIDRQGTYHRRHAICSWQAGRQGEGRVSHQRGRATHARMHARNGCVRVRI